MHGPRPRYTSLTAQRKWSVLPEVLQRSIVTLSENVEQNRPIDTEAQSFIRMMADLPPAAIASAASEIPLLGGLYHRYPIGHRLWRSVSPIGVERDALEATPALAWLYLFHGDGRLREAALNRIHEAPGSAFQFTALAFWLNDWVEPVRIIAAACARRVFPGTAPPLVAAAALYLLGQKQLWKRWGQEAVVLDETLFRQDVADCLASVFRDKPVGSLSGPMRQVLRHDRIDRHLPDLFENAAQPGIRAIALQCLIEGRAVWPDGFRQEWVDKSLARSRRVTDFRERDIRQPIPLATLITSGAADRSAAVRKIAADGLIEHRNALTGMQDTARKLLHDRSRAVRERMDFYIRQTQGEASQDPFAYSAPRLSNSPSALPRRQ